MRRLLLILAIVALAVLLVALPAAGDDDGRYEIRAVFDNGSFIVPDEEVRIAGATVGRIADVEVSGDDEIVSEEGGGRAIPGKAIVVMEITDDAFKDFREDASCLIRPQSLIGERFVDCTPTQPRAAGTEPPPELEQIPEGEPGEGQRLLPLERNGKSVDLDLINNIYRMPYRDRFRLILNDLGAGLAARGDDLGEIVDRANPALRQTNRVVRILAQQSNQLASLASDGDAVLQELAANRTSITGFFRNAAISGAAAAERKPDIEAGLRKFPGALREVRATMRDLEAFADQGTPLMTDIGASAKYISAATKKLKPFANNATPALISLGQAAEESGPLLVQADPLLIDLVGFARSSEPIGNNLGPLLDTFAETNGFRYLMTFIYNSVGSINGFDQFGRYLRSNLQISNCVDISAIVVQGCEAFFQQVEGQQKKKKKKKKKSAASSIQSAPRTDLPDIPLLPDLDELIPGLAPELPGAEDGGEGEPGEPAEPGESEPGEDGRPGEDAAPGDASESESEARLRRRLYAQSMGMDDASMFLEYLLGAGA